MPDYPTLEELRRGERAVWGAPPTTPDKPRARLLEWRALRKNTLRGFAVVELPIGLVIREIGVHEKGGKWWAGLPSRPVLDHDGQHVVNQTGKKQYAALLGWRDRNLADRFSDAVVALVRAEHPGDPEAGP